MAETSPEVKAWYQIRIRAIHTRATAHDILRRNGIELKNTGEREEQFSCPFHGRDEKPSARVYPGSPQSPSHIWCFVCKERLDAIGLWRKFNGGEDKSFHASLAEMERHYGLPTPAVPADARRIPQPVAEKDKGEFERLCGLCEHRLRDTRDDYVRLNDMTGYLAAGAVLDRTLHQTNEGHMGFREGVEVLKILIQRIGEKVRGGARN
jgi:hypothetical protein